MFNFDTDHGRALNEAITSIFSTLQNVDDSSDDANTAVDNLVKLVKVANESVKLKLDSEIEAEKLRNETEKLRIEAEKLQIEQEKLRSWRPSPDAIVAVAGTIATAILVLNFEKLGVITSKAFTFIGKTMK